MPSILDIFRPKYVDVPRGRNAPRPEDIKHIRGRSPVRPTTQQDWQTTPYTLRPPWETIQGPWPQPAVATQSAQPAQPQAFGGLPVDPFGPSPATPDRSQATLALRTFGRVPPPLHYELPRPGYQSNPMPVPARGAATQAAPGVTPTPAPAAMGPQPNLGLFPTLKDVDTMPGWLGRAGGNTTNPEYKGMWDAMQLQPVAPQPPQDYVPFAAPRDAYGESFNRTRNMDFDNGVVPSPAQLMAGNRTMTPELAADVQHNASMQAGTRAIGQQSSANMHNDTLPPLRAIQPGYGAGPAYGPNVGGTPGMAARVAGNVAAQQEAAAGDQRSFDALMAGKGLNARVAATNPVLGQSLGLPIAGYKGQVGQLAQNLGLNPLQVAQGIVGSPGDTTAQDRHVALTKAALADAASGATPMYVGPYRGSGVSIQPLQPPVRSAPDSRYPGAEPGEGARRLAKYQDRRGKQRSAARGDTIPDALKRQMVMQRAQGRPINPTMAMFDQQMIDNPAAAGDMVNNPVVGQALGLSVPERLAGMQGQTMRDEAGIRAGAEKYRADKELEAAGLPLQPEVMDRYNRGQAAAAYFGGAGGAAPNPTILNQLMPDLNGPQTPAGAMTPANVDERVKASLPLAVQAEWQQALTSKDPVQIGRFLDSLQPPLSPAEKATFFAAIGPQMPGFFSPLTEFLDTPARALGSADWWRGKGLPTP